MVGRKDGRKTKQWTEKNKTASERNEHKNNKQLFLILHLLYYNTIQSTKQWMEKNKTEK